MMQHKWYFATFVLATVCALATGYIVEVADAATNVSVILRTASVGVALLATMLGSIAALRFAGADFGRVELPCSMLGCSQFFALILLGLVCLQGTEYVGELVTYYFLPVPTVFIFLNVRLPLVLVLAWTCILMTTPMTPVVTAESIIMWAHLCLTCYMPYLKDHRLALLWMCYLFNCVSLGSSLFRVHRKSSGLPDGFVFVAAANIVMAYLIYVFARRRRHFPQSLRTVKFVRLGYLRTLLSSAERLRRCQELPPEAFGDPEKAAYVIIASHRWLDRFTCDVPTSECPEGLRLVTMVRRLDSIFPQSCAGACSQGALSFFSLIWRGVVHGGSDVLVFFDFSGLPQIGKTHDGELIPRTDAEVAQFQEALPSMGVLYTMFPVLVLPEVSRNVHPYFSSGWCSSEFYSAMLANQLAPFSTEAVAAYADYVAQGSDASGPMMSQRTLESLCVGTLDPSAVDDFNTAFERDLETKKFFDENDRTAVRDIVQGFLLKRLLADAVSNQDAQALKTLIEKLQARDMIETLGQPLDDALDTLLHRAVRLPSVEIVEALLEAGASPSALNLRGDTPAQFFALPRITAGARLCRSRQGNPAQHQYAAVVTI